MVILPQEGRPLCDYNITPNYTLYAYENGARLIAHKSQKTNFPTNTMFWAGIIYISDIAEHAISKEELFTIMECTFGVKLDSLKNANTKPIFTIPSSDPCWLKSLYVHVVKIQTNAGLPVPVLNLKDVLEMDANGPMFLIHLVNSYGTARTEVHLRSLDGKRTKTILTNYLNPNRNALMLSSIQVKQIYDFVGTDYISEKMYETLSSFTIYAGKNWLADMLKIKSCETPTEKPSEEQSTTPTTENAATTISPPTVNRVEISTTSSQPVTICLNGIKLTITGSAVIEF